MNLTLIKKLLFIVIVMTGLSAKASLKINEIMQSNVFDLIDDLNEFPDSWVEIYNEDSVDVSIQGYSLGISTDSSEYVLPDTTIKANGYIIIYCDKESVGMHTHFKLNVDEKAILTLYDKDKSIVDQIDIPEMPAPNIAYGKVADENTWSYFKKSSPNNENSGVHSDYVLSKVKYSVKGGFFSDTIKVSLSLDKNDQKIPDVVIRYTTDGSEPTDTSTLYVDSLVISSNVVIKAKTFHDSLISKPSKANTYLFFDRDVTLPVISLSLDSSYLYDDEIGIYVKGTYGENHPEQKSEIPTIGNYNYLFSWKRPVNIEYFDSPTAKESVINQLCELKIGGNYSRRNKLKSFVLNANKRFGTKHFSYPFWNDKPNVIKSKSLYLRNGGGDFANAMFRDAAAQMSMGKHVDLDWEAYQPVIVFLNGKYWGLLNLRERAHEDYVWANYDHLEDIDFLNNGRVSYGTSKEWNSFKTLYSTKTTTYEELCSAMDVDEFLNFFIFESFYANMDFPSNNFRRWRKCDPSAKWRFFAYDIDNSWGYTSTHVPTYPYLNYILREKPFSGTFNSEQACLLYQKMMSFKEFENQYIDRQVVYMGTFMSPNKINGLLDSLVANVEYEEPFFYEDVLNRSMDIFYTSIETMQDWVNQRVPYMYSYIGDFFGIGSPIPLIIDGTASQDSLFFNDIFVEDRIFNGMYYPNRSINLTHNDNLGYWQVSYLQDPNTVMMDTTSIGTANIDSTLMDIDSYTYKVDTFLTNTLNYNIPNDAIDVKIEWRRIDDVETSPKEDGSEKDITKNHDFCLAQTIGDHYVVVDYLGRIVKKTSSYEDVANLNGRYLLLIYKNGKILTIKHIKPN